jgi:hypothetical protein
MGEADPRIMALHRADLQFASLSVRERGELATFHQCRGEGLLDEDVPPRLERFAGVLEVEPVGRRHDDEIEIEIEEGVDRGCPWYAITSADGRGKPRTRVTNAHEFDPRRFRRGRQMGNLSDSAAPDDPDPQWW